MPPRMPSSRPITRSTDFTPAHRSGPWILRIAANEARNRRTAAYRRPTLALSAVENRPSGDAALSPEAAALAADQSQMLLAAD